MKLNRIPSIALAATWAGLLVGYWPSGCTQSHAGSGSGSSAPQATSPEAVPAAPTANQNGRVTILPSPAFALAHAADPSGATVTLADIAERCTPSVVTVASRRKVRNRNNPQEDMFRFFFGPGGGEPQGEREEQGL